MKMLIGIALPEGADPKEEASFKAYVGEGLDHLLNHGSTGKLISGMMAEGAPAMAVDEILTTCIERLIGAYLEKLQLGAVVTEIEAVSSMALTMFAEAALAQMTTEMVH